MKIPDRELCTVVEVMKLLHIKTRPPIYRMIYSGELEAIYAGARFLVYKDSIDKYLAEKKVKVVSGQLMQGGKPLDKLKY